jgi:hypothetical protein
MHCDGKASLANRIQRLSDCLSGDVIDQLHGPFLVSAFNEFRDSPQKILYVGQETYGWIPFKKLLGYPDDSVKELKKLYEDFDFAQTSKARRSPFWRFHRDLVLKLGLHYRSLLWSNLVRFDMENSKPLSRSIIGQSYEKLIMKAQHGMLRNEIEEHRIEKVIFLTGPNYDFILKQEFTECQFVRINAGYSERELCSVVTKDYPNIKMIRTYHPAYLVRSRKYNDILNICAGILV